MGQKNEDSLKKNSFGGINNNSLEGGMKEGMEKGLTEREREGRGEGEAALVSDVIYAAAAELDPLSFLLRTVRPGKMTPKVPG